MALDNAELVTKNGGAVGFLVASLQLSVFVMAGFVWLTVWAYRRGDTAVGILFTILLVIVGGGVGGGVSTRARLRLGLGPAVAGATVHDLVVGVGAVARLQLHHLRCDEEDVGRGLAGLVRVAPVLLIRGER